MGATATTTANKPRTRLLWWPPAPGTAEEWLADLLHSNRERENAVGAEVLRVANQECQPIRCDMDPLTAFYVASALAHSAGQPAFASPAVRDHVQKIASSIEAQIEVQCPELAQVLADFRRRAGEGAL